MRLSLNQPRVVIAGLILLNNLSMPNHVLVALMMESNVGTPNKNGVNPRLLMEKFKKDALVITIYHACSCFCKKFYNIFLNFIRSY